MRGVLPRFVTQPLRRLRTRLAPTPPEPLDRLVFAVDGGAAVIGIARRRKGWRLRRLVLVSRSGRYETAYAFAPPDDTEVATATVPLAEVIRDHEVRGDSADLYAEWSKPGKDELSRQRVGGFTETIRPPQAQRASIDGVDVRLDVTVNGNLSLRFDEDPRTGVTGEVEALTWTGDSTRVSWAFSTNNRAVTAARLVATGRRSEIAIPLDVTAGLDERRTRADHGLLHFRIETPIHFAAIAARLPDLDDILDLEAEIELESTPGEVAETVRLPFRPPAQLPEHRLQSSTARHAGLVNVFIPYLTYRTQKLAFRLERFAAADHAYLRRLLRWSWLFPLVKPFTRIWLVGETPYKAQDNGLAFFRHVRTRHPRRRVYYVIEASSPDRAKVAELGNVVDRWSRRHIRLSLLASRLVCSHHAEYLYASRDRAVQRRTRGVRVFLQHGVTAVKNVTSIYARQNTQELPTERFLVCSELERRIVVEDYGYRPHQVPITGFARFDTLFADPGEVSSDRTVVVMPSWREGLRPASFTESDYYRDWHGMLTDERLRRPLDEHGLRLRFVLHPNMRLFADFFTVPGVELIRQDDIDVQQLLRQSSVLITDYSSVAWDFAFLGKPVIYLQFTARQLVGNRAPHIDFATSLPGPVTTSVAELLPELARVAAGDGRLGAPYDERAAAFLAARDTENCARIYRAVDRAWRPNTVLDRIRNARWTQRRWWSFRRGPHYLRWMLRLYALGSRLPRTDTVVVECDRGTHFGEAPRHLYERLVRRGRRPRIVVPDNTTLRLTEPGTAKVQRRSPAYFWALSRARWWINNQNFPPELVKPAGTRFLQTWHGTPLKKMQHDVAQMASRDADYAVRAARLTSYWDLLLSGSPYATACFRSAFRVPEDVVVELGYPRNDVFSWPDADRRAHDTRQRLGLGADPRKIILYAPTFRDDRRAGVHWKHDLALDVEQLAAALGEDHVLVLRFHPLVRQGLGSLSPAARSFVVDASGYRDVQELLLVADALVTDYSSVMFDYALLGRPMIFFAYDLAHYADTLRGFYLDYLDAVPGPVVYDDDALLARLRDLDGVAAAYRDRIAAFASTYAPRDDGGASDRVLDAFFGAAISPGAVITPG